MYDVYIEAIEKLFGKYKDNPRTWTEISLGGKSTYVLSYWDFSNPNIETHYFSDEANAKYFYECLVDDLNMWSNAGIDEDAFLKSIIGFTEDEYREMCINICDDADTKMYFEIHGEEIVIYWSDYADEGFVFAESWRAYFEENLFDLAKSLVGEKHFTVNEKTLKLMIEAKEN